MKRMYGLIVILIAFLTVAFFGENHQQEANKKIPQVGVLTLMHHPALDEIYRGFKAELKLSGYVNGKNVRIDYQNANNDQSNLRTMATRLADEQSDVLVGITTPAAQALANTTSKTPIVLGAVTDPKVSGLIKNLRHPEANITGVSDAAPVSQQLDLIKEFMPNLKTLGVIYTSSDSSAVSGFHEIERECKRRQINLKSFSIANSNDLNQVSEQMFSQVDAVIVPTDNTIAGAMETLVKNGNAAKKPIFPAAATMVKQGGLATYSVNQYKLGKMTGKMTVALLKGKKVSSLPIERVKKGEPVINLKEANELNLQVPQKFLRECQRNGVVYR
ncbi:MAG: ABC transporter substrate-binding protein [Lactobacillus sp.]|uniref:tryptophan ABC transporter substrate-binding protein n=1 Tax=Lactobacillus sp. TaxID=1591 RepID=UPI0023C0AF98|nr:tryptophan ABC transporter substrate-binding protein [Lactobacillus sp.]MDE7049803.1 ABC transporter substrate-binding protein [Lactobacillus sp.]